MNTSFKTTAAVVLLVASIYGASCASTTSAKGPIGGSSPDTMTHKVVRFFGPIGGSSPDTMIVQTGSSTTAIGAGDVLYLETLGSRTNVVTARANYMTEEPLQRYIDALPKDQFVRVHRNYVVAKKSITAYKKDRVQVGNVWIPIEKMYRRAVQAMAPGM